MSHITITIHGNGPLTPGAITADIDDDDQYHGLCAVCGERVDYGQDDHNRETDNHLDCDGIFD